MRYTVVGAGAAGLAAVRAIIREEKSAEITVISADQTPFYFRPMLVDLFNREQFQHDVKTPPTVYENVTWKLGSRVKSVEPKSNRITLTSGETVQYDFLILASGSIPDLDFISPFRQYVRTLHNYSDILRLKQTLGKGQVLVLGGGYIAVEIIRQLVNHGNKVVYFARPDLFWSRELPGVTAREIEQLLVNTGVPPQFGVEVADIFDVDGKTLSVLSTGGKTFQVETIIAAPAETPNTKYLKGSGIRCEDGIIVDEELKTNFPNVFACGDCAQVLDVKNQVNRINFGWRSAEKQGEIAGQNAVGRNSVYIPNSDDFYFLDLLGKSLFDRWVGNPHEAEA